MSRHPYKNVFDFFNKKPENKNTSTRFEKLLFRDANNSLKMEYLLIMTPVPIEDIPEASSKYLYQGEHSGIYSADFISFLNTVFNPVTIGTNYLLNAAPNNVNYKITPSTYLDQKEFDTLHICH